MTDDLDQNSRSDAADQALDQRLHTHAARWRTNLPEPSREFIAPDINSNRVQVRDQIPTGRRHLILPVVAAAIVLISVIIGIVVIRLPGRTTAVPPMQQPAGQPSDNPTGRQTGTLTGVVVMTGGPPGTPNSKVTSGKVRAVRNDGRTRTADIAKNASYTLTLAPGNYRIQAKTPLWNGGTSFGCQHDALVHIRAGRTTTATIQCQRR